MIHYFYTTPEQAHQLTKLSKRHGFYFKTLHRTNDTDNVRCEVTEPGREYINANGLDVEWALTYDVVFNDERDSKREGFRSSVEDCKRYIKANNGTDSSRFADYKGGIVQVVCNETGETVYGEEVR